MKLIEVNPELKLIEVKFSKRRSVARKLSGISVWWQLKTNIRAYFLDFLVQCMHSCNCLFAQQRLQFTMQIGIMDLFGRPFERLPRLHGFMSIDRISVRRYSVRLHLHWAMLFGILQNVCALHLIHFSCRKQIALAQEDCGLPAPLTFIARLPGRILRLWRHGSRPPTLADII